MCVLQWSHIEQNKHFMTQFVYKYLVQRLIKVVDLVDYDQHCVTVTKNVYNFAREAV